MEAESVIQQYYFYNAAFNATRALYISTYGLFLTDSVRLPVSWIPWLLAINLIVTTICEAPTGAYADLHGRRRSFLLACFVTTLGYLIYSTSSIVAGFAPRLGIAILGEMSLALGFGFYSGALDAWAVDLQPSGAEPQALKKIFVHGQLWKNIFYAIGGVVGVALFAKRENALVPGTFLSAAILCGILTLHAARHMRRDETRSVDGCHQIDQPIAALRRLARQVLLGTRIVWSDFRLSGLVATAAIAFLYLQVLVLYWPWFLAHSGTSSIAGAKGAAVPIAVS